MWIMFKVALHTEEEMPAQKKCQLSQKNHQEEPAQPEDYFGCTLLEQILFSFKAYDEQSCNETTELVQMIAWGTKNGQLDGELGLEDLEGILSRHSNDSMQTNSLDHLQFQHACMFCTAEDVFTAVTTIAYSIAYSPRKKWSGFNLTNGYGPEQVEVALLVLKTHTTHYCTVNQSYVQHYCTNFVSCSISISARNGLLSKCVILYSMNIHMH